MRILLGLCAVATLSAAAPTLNGEQTLVRTKRADEIIFDEHTKTDSIRVKKSDPESADTSSNDVSAQTDDVIKSDDHRPEEENKQPADEVEQPTEADQLEVDENVDMTEPVVGNEDDSENAATSDVIEDDVTERRRRRAAVAPLKLKRQQRAASRPRTMMVAENMAAPAAQKLRAKRDLDADEIRELFDAQRAPSSDYYDDDFLQSEEPIEYSNYGPVLQSTDQLTPWNYYEQGRPKRARYEVVDGAAEEEEDDDDRPTLSDQLYEEEAEREAVRELLAERAAEEARQALLLYLSGGPRRMPLDVQEDDDEETDDGENFDDDGQRADADVDGAEFAEPDGEPRDVDESWGYGPSAAEAGDDDGGNGYENAPAAAAKRFGYPYSYEPYGGRWGAVVPGSKRADRDPYDRLYRLAEALSGPPRIAATDAEDAGPYARE